MSLISLAKVLFFHPVTRDQKLRSASRFLKWQIGSRLVNNEIVYEWINGAKFKVRTGETGLTGNIYAGLHEFPDMSFLLHLLRKGDFFVDVGANVGSYTLLACAAIGARGCAFEPVPDTYKRLVDNVRLNNIEDNVICINKGVGSKIGTLSFTCDADTMNHAMAPDESSDNSTQVDVVTLDSTLSNDVPVLIKIDVEGFESNVLDGASNILSNPDLQCVIMELNGCGNRYGFNEDDILNKMVSHGFSTYSYNPFLRELNSIDGKNNHSGNTIFVKDINFVNDRVKSAEKILIHGKEI